MGRGELPSAASHHEDNTMDAASGVCAARVACVIFRKPAGTSEGAHRGLAVDVFYRREFGLKWCQYRKAPLTFVLLNVPVVPEGVETRHQLAFLACDEVQGFFIGPPRTNLGRETRRLIQRRTGTTETAL